jgi:hypothetical protein
MVMRGDAVTAHADGSEIASGFLSGLADRNPDADQALSRAGDRLRTAITERAGTGREPQA